MKIIEKFDKGKLNTLIIMVKPIIIPTYSIQTEFIS